MSFYQLSVPALLLALVSPVSALTLEQAEALALSADLRHDALQHRASARREDAAAEAALQDPRLSLSARNYPADDFDPDREPMTMNFVGLSQAFPAPGVRAARRQLAEARAGELGAQSRLATLKTLRQVRLLWTDLWFWRQAEQVAAGHEEHFRQSLDSVSAAYRSGGASQQALFQLQSGLQRVSEQRLHARQRLRELRHELRRWIDTEVAEELQPALPEVAVEESGERVHPLLRIEEEAMERYRREQRLARRSARPDWGLELGYGFRSGGDAMSEQRPDMVSLGLSMELPVFAGARDRRREKAAAMRAEAARAGRQDQARMLETERRRTRAALAGLEQRLRLMKEEWLPAVRREAETTLRAYQAGTAPFSEVIDSRMQWLETRRRYDALRAERARALVQLRYLAATDLDGEAS